MSVSTGPRPTRKNRASILVRHGLIGAVAGYLVLHPSAMLIHPLFEAGFESWPVAVALAFDTSHLSMALYFVALGTIGGVMQGIYVHGLARLNQELQLLARTDDLTGLCNRRQLFYLLRREVRRVRRNGGQLCLAVLDIDHFKRYNDSHGHPAGDDLLHVLAQLLTRCVREVDIVARYGGEEFVLVFPDVGLERAGDIVERIRMAVKEHPFLGAQAQPLRRVTASVGLAELGTDSPSVGQLLRNADAALYAAKRGGRDQIRSWRQAPDCSTAPVAPRGTTNPVERRDKRASQPLKTGAL